MMGDFVVQGGVLTCMLCLLEDGFVMKAFH